MLQLSLSVELESVGLEEQGFAGSDLMAGRLPWDAEILHWEGFVWTLGD